MWTFILWLILLVVCWPLALLALVLYPFVWLLMLPFKLIGITVDAVFTFLHALLMLPARILTGPSAGTALGGADSWHGSRALYLRRPGAPAFWFAAAGAAGVPASPHRRGRARVTGEDCDRADGAPTACLVAWRGAPGRCPAGVAPLGVFRQVLVA